MTVKEILLSSATCMGREDIAQYLKESSNSNTGKDTLNAVAVMVRLLNIVLSELASTYIPMVKKEQIKIEEGKFLLADLSENIIEILGVYNNYGEKIYYKIAGEYLQVDSAGAVIEYKYLPSNYGLEDEIGYSQGDISKMTLACGLNAEFCISEGDFDCAVMWHERYVDAIKCICMPKNSRIKSRCWL